MPLRDISAYREWVVRSHPSEEACRVVAAFCFQLADEPWAAPSLPFEELSNRPFDEARSATLDVPGGGKVWVYYRVYFSGGHVDLAAVMST